MSPEQSLKAFDSLVLKAGEMFEDYCIMVRVEGGCFISRSSDPCWAVGAARRYIHNIETDDAIELTEAHAQKRNE